MGFMAVCRSAEPLAGLAVWSDETVVIELEKADAGLGFSILDYQVGSPHCYY